MQRIMQIMKQSADLKLSLTEDDLAPFLLFVEATRKALKNGHKLLVFGNGGSAADAQHIAAELVGRYHLERAGMPAIALTTDSSILTSIGNDYGFDKIFARQVAALAKPGDVVLGISTSGNSMNIKLALEQANMIDAVTTGALLGNTGGEIRKCVDHAVIIPSGNTARIQECHITLGHILCELVDDARETAPSTPQSAVSPDEADL